VRRHSSCSASGTISGVLSTTPLHKVAAKDQKIQVKRIDNRGKSVAERLAELRGAAVVRSDRRGKTGGHRVSGVERIARVTAQLGAESGGPQQQPRLALVGAVAAPNILPTAMENA
jgi:hypothetical protein